MIRFACPVCRKAYDAPDYAAELLMTERILKADLAMIEQLDLEDEASLGQLAGRYEVSVQALSFRVANLGLVTI